MRKQAWQLTKWWQKAVCALGIPILVNTIAAAYFLNAISITIALIITTLFIYDVVKRRHEKVIWDLDDRWERIVYVIAWTSLILAIILILMSLIAGAS